MTNLLNLEEEKLWGLHKLLGRQDLKPYFHHHLPAGALRQRSCQYLPANKDQLPVTGEWRQIVGKPVPAARNLTISRVSGAWLIAAINSLPATKGTVESWTAGFISSCPSLPANTLTDL